MMLQLLLFVLALLMPRADAQSGSPPVIDDAARMRAARVVNLGDTDPVLRMNMILAARDLDEAALFVLAGTHPGMVEQLTSDRYRLAIELVAALPSPELGRIRRGETVIRKATNLRGRERAAAIVMAEYYEFKGFKEKKLGAVRVGPLEARVIRVEVTFDKNKRKTFSGTTELAWPSTPDRDERSRTELARHFGARPSRSDAGAGATLALRDGSFETDAALSGIWSLVQGVNLGSDVPVGEVHLDSKVAVDGIRSVRFHNEEKTRMFPQLVQKVAVIPGTTVRTRVHFKAERLRVEYLQRETNVFLGVVFLDANGTPLGSPDKALARLESHQWELLEIQATVPASARWMQVGLSCAVSGTGWFDGVVAEIVR